MAVVFEEGLFVAGFVFCFECPEVGGEECRDAADGVDVGDFFEACAVAELPVPAVDTHAFPLEGLAEEFEVTLSHLAADHVEEVVAVDAAVAAHEGVERREAVCVEECRVGGCAVCEAVH